MIVNTLHRTAFITWLLNKRGVDHHVKWMEANTRWSQPQISRMMKSVDPMNDDFFHTILKLNDVVTQEIKEFNSQFITTDEYIALLKKHNDFLEKVVVSSLELIKGAVVKIEAKDSDIKVESEGDVGVQVNKPQGDAVQNKNSVKGRKKKETKPQQ